MLSDFPKTETLKEGTKIILRPMTKDDGDKLWEFFSKMPKDDRMYLRHDVSQRSVIDNWIEHLNYDKVLPILAEAEGKIVGDATLHREEYGWIRHVGQIRIVVDKNFRKKGLGAILAREIYFLALKTGLHKLTAEVISEQQAVIQVFEKLGFRKEALLREHVIDSRGRRHDLAILSNSVENLWRQIQEYQESAFPSYPMEG